MIVIVIFHVLDKWYVILFDFLRRRKELVQEWLVIAKRGSTQESLKNLKIVVLVSSVYFDELVPNLQLELPSAERSQEILSKPILYQSCTYL